MTSNDHTASNPSVVHDTPRRFVTTHWTMVAQAAEAGTAEGRAALEQLCRIYWAPLYAFARRRGMSPADAEDLTQGFFADLLERGAISRADVSRGRFRTFLLASFRNFQSHQRERANSQKRGGGQSIVSLEELREAESHFSREPATDETPEKIYDRKWAGRLLAETLAAVQREYGALGKADVLEALKPALWQRGGESGYAEIARRLGMSEGAVKVAVHRLRKRFGELLRAEVSKTVLTPNEAEDELRHLLAVVSA